MFSIILRLRYIMLLAFIPILHNKLLGLNIVLIHILMPKYENDSDIQIDGYKDKYFGIST